MSPIETSTKDGTSVLRENDESQIERAQDHLKQEFSKPPLFEYFQVQDCSISTR
jgi:hypothetical protein